MKEHKIQVYNRAQTTTRMPREVICFDYNAVCLPPRKFYGLFECEEPGELSSAITITHTLMKQTNNA